MGRFAAGTDAYDEGLDRRARHATQRRQNVADALLGFGMLAQQMGAARRQREQQASEQLYADRLGQLMGGQEMGEPQVVGDPFSQPAMALPSDRGGESRTVPGGHMATPSFEQTIRGDMGGGQPSAMENLKNTFTFGQSAPRLRPEHAMALYQAVQGQRQQKNALDRQRIEDERWAIERGDKLGEGKADRDSAEKIAGVRASALGASGGQKGALTQDQKFNNAMKLVGEADKAEALARKIGAYNNIDFDDSLLEKLTASDDPNDREVGSLLKSVQYDTPEVRKKKIEEYSNFYADKASKYKGSPAHKEAVRFLTQDYPRLSRGDSPAAPTATVDIDALTPEQLISIGNIFEAEGIDPDSATPEQIAEALSRAGNQ